MKGKLLIIIMSLVLAVSMLCLTGCGSNEETAGGGPSAAAATGTYIGNDNDGVQEFLGIRYGEMEQYKPATDVTTSTEDQIEAKEWGYNCLQPYDEVEVASQDPCSRDCLYLNIWTKDVNTTDKPVIVWIHGGGTHGGATDPMYDGEYFVRNLPDGEDCVFVSMNFRMSFMGACDLSGLEGYTDEYADAINLTKLDQMQALKWLNENVGAFGGDKERVTIMGQSSGGASVQELMSDPKANQYFKRAIQCSGVTSNTTISKEALTEWSKEAFEILGVKSIDELCALTDEQILEHIEEINNEINSRIMMGGRYADGKIMLETWWDDLREGSAKDIDLLIGSTNGETDYTSIDWETGELATDPSHVFDRIKATEEESPDVYGRYYAFSEDGLADDYLALGDDKVQLAQDLYNNLYTTYPSYVTAEEQSKWNENTYLYYWEYAPSPKSVIEYAGEAAEVSPWGRALHCMDACFVFGTKEGYVEMTGDPGKMSDELIQKTQMAWYSFAKTGDPNNEYLDTEWKPFSENNKNTMVITEDEKYSCEKNYLEDEMNVLSRLRPYGEK
jgi:para-nitrobenzyl esterase